MYFLKKTGSRDPYGRIYSNKMRHHSSEVSFDGDELMPVLMS